LVDFSLSYSKNKKLRQGQGLTSLVHSRISQYQFFLANTTELVESMQHMRSVGLRGIQ